MGAINDTLTCRSDLNGIGAYFYNVADSGVFRSPLDLWYISRKTA